MATRTGLQAFTKVCKAACKLLGVWQPSIVGAINATGLAAGDKALAINTITAINAGCEVFVVLSTKWEN